MSWTLSDAKVRYGIASGDTSKDAILTSQMSGALEIAEKYCDRFFLFKAGDKADFYRFNYDTVQLRRYPILGDVVEVDLNESQIDATQYKINGVNGRILLNSYAIDSTISVTWSGGYFTDGVIPDGGVLLPYTVEVALYMILDILWQKSSASIGSSSGDISSVTIPDVGTIRFTDNSGESGITKSFADAFSLLDPYRIWSV